MPRLMGSHTSGKYNLRSQPNNNINNNVNNNANQDNTLNIQNLTPCSVQLHDIA